jgi:hypothetical protein
VTDIPTVVWSPHGHPEAVDALLELTQSVLWDSVDADDPAAALARASDLCESAHVVDLAWLRTTPWRERVAAYFDPPPARRLLPAISRVTVRHTPGSEAAGMLFLGWLASRLDWRPETLVHHDGSLLGKAPARRQDVALELQRTTQSVPGLAGVTIETADGAALSLERGPGGLRALRAPPTGASARGRSSARRAARAASSARGSARRSCATRPTGPALALARSWPREADHRRRPARRQPVPADRRLRVPVGLRDLGARGAQRQRRVAVPQALRLAERLRRRCSTARPAASCSRRSTCRSGGAPLPAGHDILETTWDTNTGWVIVRDLLVIGPWHDDEERSSTHRRAPTDWDAEHILLRTMRCVNGSVEMHMECEPMMDYGRKPVEWEYTGPGYHEAVGRAEGSELELHLNTNLRMGFEDSAPARARRCTRATWRSPR